MLRLNVEVSGSIARALWEPGVVNDVHIVTE